jgi:2'-5' RNA ligase
MKSMQKYFLAIVPTDKIEEAATSLKLDLKDQFNIKYALKSPAHVTLKMPFSYNEAKENLLVERLSAFLATKKPFKIQVGGTGTFGKRVIFWKIKAGSELYDLQTDLKTFCKRELNLVDELSDRNYHPHMTIAFKDVKDRDFEDVLNLVSKNQVSRYYQVNELILLKKLDGRWTNYSVFDLQNS